ncbi:MAG: glycosyltransferase family 2 protein [Aggregatilineales bacterium]
MTPLTVAVINYNGAHVLERCLDALLASTYPIDELLLVDNGSTDDSLTIARAYAPRLRALELGYNGGPAAARNAALRMARNDLIFLLDEDGFVLPDTLERLVETYCYDPHSIAIVHPRIVFDTEPARIQYDGGSVHYVGIAIQHNRNALRGQVAEDWRRVWVTGGNVLVDRAKIPAPQRYDEAFFWGFEDADFAVRISLAGWRCIQQPKALIRHGSGTPGLSMRSGARYSAARAYHVTKNRAYFLFKIYRWRTFAIIAPALLLYELVTLAFMIKLGTVGAWLRGWGRFFRDWPQVMEKRRLVQQTRQYRDRDFLKAGPLTYSVGTAQGRFVQPLIALLALILNLYWLIVSRLV